MAETPPLTVGETTALLIEALDNLDPLLDTADGLRARLEARGWSPAAAESAALTWLHGALAATWRVPNA